MCVDPNYFSNRNFLTNCTVVNDRHSISIFSLSRLALTLNLSHLNSVCFEFQISNNLPNKQKFVHSSLHKSIYTESVEIFSFPFQEILYVFTIKGNNCKMASIFSGIEVGPKIEVFALNKAYQEDPSPVKVNLGVGGKRCLLFIVFLSKCLEYDSSERKLLCTCALVRRHIF